MNISYKATKSGKKKHRQLPMEDCLHRVSAERKENAEVFVSPRMTETDITDSDRNTEGLLEPILAKENLNRAYKQV